MAFAITNFALEADMSFDGLPVPANAVTGAPQGATGSQADLTVAAAATTDSTIINAGVPCTTFHAYVYLKTPAGTGTFQVKLQASSSATFASNIVDLDLKYYGAYVTTNTTRAFHLFGNAPLISGLQYMRLEFVTGAGTSDVADIIYYAS